MEVRTLGRLAALGCASCDEGPPSSQSILALYRGEQGALFKVLTSTALRGVLIAPGVFIAARWAGARGTKLVAATVGGSLVSAVGITAFLALYYAWKKPAGATQAAPQTPPAQDGALVDPSVRAAQSQQQASASPAALVPQDLQNTVGQTMRSMINSGEQVMAPQGLVPQRTPYGANTFGSRPW